MVRKQLMMKKREGQPFLNIKSMSTHVNLKTVKSSIISLKRLKVLNQHSLTFGKQLESTQGRMQTSETKRVINNPLDLKEFLKNSDLSDLKDIVGIIESQDDKFFTNFDSKYLTKSSDGINRLIYANPGAQIVFDLQMKNGKLLKLNL